MLALAGTWLLLWLVMQPAGNTPFNDDWAYAFAARSIAETGQFRLTGFSAPNLIAQAYWGALFCLPFGFSFTALHASTLALVAGLAHAHEFVPSFGNLLRPYGLGADSNAFRPPIPISNRPPF